MVLIEVGKLAISTTAIQSSKIHPLRWTVRQAEELPQSTQKLQVSRGGQCIGEDLLFLCLYVREPLHTPHQLNSDDSNLLHVNIDHSNLVSVIRRDVIQYLQCPVHCLGRTSCQHMCL